MSYYAQLDSNNIVQQVLVMPDELSNPECLDWLRTNIGDTNWIGTFYTGAIRKQYAGIGYTFHAGRNNFIASQPFGSWALDENDDWQPPAPHPNDGKRYDWNENIPDWVEQ